MLSVQAIYEIHDPVALGLVVVKSVLLGTGFENQFIADSIEKYEQGIALPIIGEDLFEQLFESGVSPIGGGKFSFWNEAVVQGQVVLTHKHPYKYALANIISLVVCFRDKEITVVPFAPVK